MRSLVLLFCLLFSNFALGQNKIPSGSNTFLGKFRISECIATGISLSSRDELTTLVGNVTKVEDLKPIIEKWAAKNKLYDVQATIHEINGSPNKYVWLQTRRFGGALTKVTVTRSETDNSSSRLLLDCIFSDTLVVIDTLKLLLNTRETDQFFIQTKTGYSSLTKDDFGALLFSATTIPGVPPGQFADVIIVHRAGSQPEIKRQFKLYIFSAEERGALLAGMKNWFNGSALSCDEMVEFGSGYIRTVFGNVNCDLNDRYRVALANSIRRLLKSSSTLCKP